ncbi:MAG: cupin domain-containing protein [Steroidobacteraceae bacterium]
MGTSPGPHHPGTTSNVGGAAPTAVSTAEDASAQLAEFERRLPEHHLAPLWKVLRTLTPREPAPVAAPTRWRAPDWRGQLSAAGRLITASRAERRVLILENAALPGESRITTSLYAGVQLLLPGETAPSHRHAATALRFVFQGEGAYTTVDEDRIPMHPGDLVITPSWSFHEHGNDGAEPVLWLDGLDVPIVNTLAAAFSEEDARHPDTRGVRGPDARGLRGRSPQVGTPEARRRRAMSSRDPAALTCFPYEQTCESLDTSRRKGPCDPHCGLRIAFTDDRGVSPMPTMGAAMQLLPAGFEGRRYRSTDGAVFAVLSGHGSIDVGGDVGGQRWPLEPHDIVVIPSWTWYALRADRDLTLFSFSDRPLQQHSSLWREQRG